MRSLRMPSRSRMFRPLYKRLSDLSSALHGEVTYRSHRAETKSCKSTEFGLPNRLTFSERPLFVCMKTKIPPEE